MIHLEPFPDDEFRWTVIKLVCASIVGTFIWDRICIALFAPQVFGAMLNEARQVKPLPEFFSQLTNTASSVSQEVIQCSKTWRCPHLACEERTRCMLNAALSAFTLPKCYLESKA